jgi:hypothetical protein
VKSVDRHVFVFLREQARSRALQSPRLWKEYKQRRRARPDGRTLPLWLVRLIWALMLALIIVPGIVRRVGPGSLLAMLAMYCSGTTFLRAADLRNRLYRSTELFVALHYPLSDRDFFRWQLRDWLMACLPVFMVSAASYVWVAVYGDADTVLWTWALLGGLAQTAIVITLSLSQELWFTRIPTKPALAFYALILCILFFPKELTSFGGQALAVLPATWVNMWLASSHIGAGGAFFMLLGVGLLAAVDAWIVRSLEEKYPRTDLTLVLQDAFEDEAPQDELASPSNKENENAAAFGRDYAVAQERFASLQNRTVVVERLTAADSDWNAGHWTTRIAGRWLTPRQRLVAEFLSADAIDAWKDRVKRATQLTAIAVFLCVIPFAVPLWLSLGVFIIAGFTRAPLLGGSWPGLTPGRFGFARLQPLASYPIGYDEASLSIMKLNAVRLLGFVPTALTAGLVIGWRYYGQPTTGLLVSAQVVVLSLAVQPYCALFLHSAGTNDTKRLNWTSSLFACTLIANAVIFIAVAIAFFVFNRTLVSWILGPPVSALASWSMWRFYGFLYGRHRIDLIPAATG